MKIVTFGEIMVRLNTNGFMKIKQSLPGQLACTFAGAEVNVAASLSMLGRNTKFVTALPEHDITEACIMTLKGIGIDTTNIVKASQGRFGLYFVETGANQRPSKVIYDRSHSSLSLTKADDYNWDEIFDGVKWFHTTGITPSLSKKAADTALYAVQQAKDKGITVSCDLNFRKKLWRWDESLPAKDLAQKIMRQMLPYVDVVIANEEDASDVLGIQAGDTDVEAGILNIEKYPAVARQIIKQFPNVQKVAITLRESISATHNNWGAMLYDRHEDAAFFAPLTEEQYQPYQIKHIVDRVGGGDSFAAGLIYALTSDELKTSQQKISFATAASCLAHSIQGDFNFSTKEEVENLMKGSASGRVIR